MTQEELLQKIGELLDQKIEDKIRPLVQWEIEEAIENRVVSLVREEVEVSAERTKRALAEKIKAGNTKLLEDIASLFHETWERMDETNERVTALEEHTGLAPKN